VRASIVASLVLLTSPLPLIHPWAAPTTWPAGTEGSAKRLPCLGPWFPGPEAGVAESDSYLPRTVSFLLSQSHPAKDYSPQTNSEIPS